MTLCSLVRYVMKDERKYYESLLHYSQEHLMVCMIALMSVSAKDQGVGATFIHSSSSDDWVQNYSRHNTTSFQTCQWSRSKLGVWCTKQSLEGVKSRESFERKKFLTVVNMEE